MKNSEIFQRNPSPKLHNDGVAPYPRFDSKEIDTLRYDRSLRLRGPI